VNNTFLNIIEYNIFITITKKGAWSELLWEINILVSKKNNIIVTDYKKGNNLQVTLQEEDLNDIKDIISKYKDVSKIKYIKMPPVFDGTQEEIFIRFDNIEWSMSSFNLWYYEDNENSSDDVKLLFEVFNDINKILKKYKLKLKINY